MKLCLTCWSLPCFRQVRAQSARYFQKLTVYPFSLVTLRHSIRREMGMLRKALGGHHEGERYE